MLCYWRFRDEWKGLETMADEADQADWNIERDTAIALKRAAAFEDEAEATGRCLSCGEDVEHGRRWCDAACRDTWQLLRRP